MSSIFARSRTRPSAVILPRWRSVVFAFAAVLALAACGAMNEGLAPGFEDEAEEETTVWEEEVGTAPAAIALFATEAEDALGTQGFEVALDAAASGGSYAMQPMSIAASTSGDVVAEIEFEVAQSGEHDLWARVYAPSLSSDATYLGFNGVTRRVFAQELGQYLWLRVTTASLEAGWNVVSLGFGEPGLRVDLVAVVGRRDVGAPELEKLVASTDGPVEEQVPPSPSPEPSPSPSPEPSPKPMPPTSFATFSLRGDPGFDVGGLSGEQRVWFERSLSSTLDAVPEMVSLARADDMYQFGRTMFQFSSAALLGLRSTGDLRFLDALDPMMQALRGELYDGWCGGVEDSLYVNARYGTVVERDGFRNFRYRLASDRDYCRDVIDLEETLTHGHLAMVMYAFHLNRDLVSPAGVDYGERADFWFDYLRNDFEAKWRERTGVAWPDMDFIDLKFSHTYNVFTLYYYFMGMRLASEGSAEAGPYAKQAEALTDAMFEQPYEPGKRGGGFVEASVPSGDAVVYSFGAPGRGSVSTTHLEATPTTYARYVMSAVLALRLEGFEQWDDAIMMRLANGMTGLVIDVSQVTRDSTIAASVTGEQVVEGMPPTTYRSRMSVGKVGATLMPAFAVWDGSGVLERFSMDVYGVTEGDANQPDWPSIPASMLFVETATAQALGLTASR